MIRCRTVGPILHQVFQSAARVGKKVRGETGLDQGKLSIASEQISPNSMVLRALASVVSKVLLSHPG